MCNLSKVVWNLRDSLSVLIDLIRKLWALAQCFIWKCKRSLSLYDLVTEFTCKLTLLHLTLYHGINRLNDYISQCKKLLIQWLYGLDAQFQLTYVLVRKSYNKVCITKWPLNTWTGRECSSNTGNYNLYKNPIILVLL